MGAQNQTGSPATYAAIGPTMGGRLTCTALGCDRRDRIVPNWLTKRFGYYHDFRSSGRSRTCSTAGGAIGRVLRCSGLSGTKACREDGGQASGEVVPRMRATSLVYIALFSWNCVRRWLFLTGVNGSYDASYVRLTSPQTRSRRTASHSRL